jgi:Tfp pilus assembly pilus retraction ATPase PilT
MTKLIRDPELQALVRELNDAGEVSGPRRPEALPLHVPEGNPLEKLLIEVAQRGASDLLLVSGAPPVFRISGRLERKGEVLSSEDVQTLFAPLLTGRLREKLESEGAADFSLRLGGAASDEDRRAWRFRINVHRAGARNRRRLRTPASPSSVR